MPRAPAWTRTAAALLLALTMLAGRLGGVQAQQAAGEPAEQIQMGISTDVIGLTSPAVVLRCRTGRLHRGPLVGAAGRNCRKRQQSHGQQHQKQHDRDRCNQCESVFSRGTQSREALCDRSFLYHRREFGFEINPRDTSVTRIMEKYHTSYVFTWLIKCNPWGIFQ